MNILTYKEALTVGNVSANSLIHGDCLDAMALIESGSVDAIIADLPYG